MAAGGDAKSAVRKEIQVGESRFADRIDSSARRIMSADDDASGAPGGSHLVERIGLQRPASGEVRLSDLERDREMDLLRGLLGGIAIVPPRDGNRFSVSVSVFRFVLFKYRI